MGFSPEVEEQMSAVSGACLPISSKTELFTSKISGTLSWINGTSLTAFSIESTNSSLPCSTCGASVNLEYARFALASISLRVCPAIAEGSKTLTSMPFSINRAAHPPPITPPPTIATFFIISLID